MEWSLGDIAGLLAALAFAYLVFRLGSVIGKAGRILDETRVSLRTTTDNVQPTLQGLTETVSGHTLFLHDGPVQELSGIELMSRP